MAAALGELGDFLYAVSAWIDRFLSNIIFALVVSAATLVALRIELSFV